MGGIQAASFAWRLTIEGAEAVTAAFTAVGEAAKGSIGGVGTVSQGASAALAGLTNSLSGVSKQVVALEGLRTTLVGLAGIGGMGLLVENSLKTATNIEEMAKQAGMGTEQFQELSYALQKFGIDQSKASEEFTKFDQNVTQFVTQNAGPAKAALDSLFGPDAQKIAQQGMRDIPAFYQKVIGQIGQLGNEGTKLLDLKGLFGKGGGDQIGPTDADVATITAYREEAERLGLVMSDQLIQSAHEAENHLGTLGDILHMKLAVAVDENAKNISYVADLLIEAVPTAAKAAVIAVDSIKTAWDLLKIAVLGTADVILISLDSILKAERDAANFIPGVHVSSQTGLEDSIAWMDKQIVAAGNDVVKNGNHELGLNDDGSLHVTIHNRSRSSSGSGSAPPPIGDLAATKQAEAEAAAYAKLTANLQSEIDAMGTSDREIFINTEERKLHTGATQDQKDAIAQLAGTLFDEKQRWDDLKGASTAAGNAISGAFEDSILKGKSFHDVLNSLETTLEDIAYKFFIGDGLSRDVTSALEATFGKGGAADSVSRSGGGIFGGILNSLFGIGGGGAASDGLSNPDIANSVIDNSVDFGGFMASGGPLDPGKWYVAGEYGPEPIWGGGPGAFASGYQSGGGVSVVVNNNSSAQVTPQVSSGADGKTQIVMMIDDAVSGLIQNPFSKVTAAMRTNARTPAVRY